MKANGSNGIFTKFLVYVLVVSMTMLYMPTAGFSVAHAAKKAPRVYVFGFAPDGQKTPLELKGMTEVQFREQFEGESRLEYISPKDARRMLKGEKLGKPTKSAKSDKKYFKRAKKYLRLAKEAVEEEEMEDLLKAGQRAVKYFKKSTSFIEDYDLVKEAYLYYAAGLEANGEDGSDALMTAMSFDPSFEPEDEWSDLLKKSYKKASKAKKNGRFALDVQPEDAKVSLNGKEYEAPVKERKLMPGDYFIRVQAEGFEPYNDIITVSGKQTKSEIVLAGGSAAADDGVDKKKVFRNLRKAAAKQKFNQQFFDDAKSFAKWIKADYLVFGAFVSQASSSDFYPLVYEAKTGDLGQVQKTAFDHDMEEAGEGVELAFADTRRAILKNFPETIIPVGGAVGAAVAVAAAPVVEEPAEPEEEMYPEPEPEPVPETISLDVDDSVFFSDDDVSKAQEDSEDEESIAPIEQTPFYKKWWFWTVIGVVVAGGAITTGVLLAPEDNDKPSSLNLPAR